MSRPLSRRMLLSRGARTFVALSTGLSCVPLVNGSEAEPETERRLRVAAIGVGNRGHDNLIELANEHVVALADVDDEYLQAAAKKFPGAKLYQDYRQLLDAESLDAVLISTPDHSHALAALMAMRRGCHVYCEKPLAHNLHETRLMSRAAQQQGVITQMANQHRSSAGYRRARQLLEAGVLGRVQSIHAWTLRPYWPQGITRPTEEQSVPKNLNWDLWLGPANARPYHAAYHPIRWRGWWDFGAGALGDMGTHLLDPVLTALQLDVPTKIHAESSEVNDETLPSWSIIRFEFPMMEGTVIEVTWYDGGKQPPRELTGADRLPDEGVLVIGERGKLFIPPLGKQPRLVPASLIDEAPAPEEEAAATSHVRQWINACKANEPKQCDTPFDEGARLTNVCLLGKLALRVGKDVSWDVRSNCPIDCPECLPWLAPEYRDGWRIE